MLYLIVLEFYTVMRTVYIIHIYPYQYLVLNQKISTQK
jgi:hypothetical protein